MDNKQKKLLKKIIIALSSFLIVEATNLVLKKLYGDIFPNGISSIFGPDWGWVLEFVAYFLIYIYISRDILKKTLKSIAEGDVLDEEFLMTLASLGAFALGIYTGVNTSRPNGFDEGCAVIIFYQVGEFFQGFAAGRARGSIKALLDLKSDWANVKKGDTFKRVDISCVKAGDIIKVDIGQRIPADGVVIEGQSALDMKSLTGESLPCDIDIGSQVLSGSVNLSSAILIKASKVPSQSTASQIMELVEKAAEKKSKQENFISRFSRVYTPVVVISALLLALLPPLFFIIKSEPAHFDIWVYRALSFLVISCPCALVLSVPLSFFQGLGAAYKKGVLVKGSVYLERLAGADSFVFDKTGTLTKGNFTVTKISPSDKKEKIIELAAIAEKDLSHPIAKSISSLCGNKDENLYNSYRTTNIQGKGIIAKSDESTILCGNEKLMSDNNIAFERADEVGNIVYVAENGEFVGYIVIEDEPKPESINTIKALNKNAKTIMLTGDKESVALKVAKELGLSYYRSSLLPGEKVKEFEKIRDKSKAAVYTGDGINDAAVLALADVGISMGTLGSDAAIEASDIVITNDNLMLIPETVKLSKKTLRVAKENIIFSISTKLLILALSAFGITNMWFAVFGDVGVAILAILNSFRVKNA